MSFLKRLLSLLIICWIIPVSVRGQQLTNEQLIDSTLSVLPQIVSIAEMGPGKIAELRTDPARSSFYITEGRFQEEDSSIMYYFSKIAVPAAKETRILDIFNYRKNLHYFHWSVVIACDYDVKNLSAGRVQGLFKDLDSVLQMQYPMLQHVQDKHSGPGGTVPLSISAKWISRDHFTIGIEAWHGKSGYRNLLRLYVTSLVK